MGASALDTIVLGTPVDEARALARALSASWLELPPMGAGDADWQAIRERVTSHAPCPRVVLAVWCEAPRPGPFVSMSPDAWLARCEAPLIAWSVALGCAADLCADEGSIVAVIEAPNSLDASEWVPESGVSDAAQALVRSVAHAEGPRGVRANAVTAPLRLAPSQLVAPAPPLDRFPGELADEVAGAVEMLLSPWASGITARTLAADCGRA
ncbi:SDR family oxidoreductase [Myxococcota bacterium]|nr:SDR family oxidoreductase [Myxococcota bacterium]